MTSLQPNPFDGTHMRARMFARRSRSRSCRTKSHRASICISQHGMSESVLGAEKYTHMCVRVLQVQLWTDCSLTVPKTPGPGISTRLDMVARSKQQDCVVRLRRNMLVEPALAPSVRVAGCVRVLRREPIVSGIGVATTTTTTCTFSAAMCSVSRMAAALPPLHFPRDRRRLPDDIVRVPADRDPNLLVASPTCQTTLASRIPPFIKRLDPGPNAFFAKCVRLAPNCRKRDAPARRAVGSGDMFQGARGEGAAAGV